MAAYIVTYDLSKRGQNYDCLYEKLDAYGTKWRMQKSVWIIVTDQEAMEIADALLPCLDENDKLFVAQVSEPAAWIGYSDRVDAWLQKRL